MFKIRWIFKLKTVELVVPCYNEGEMVPIFYKTASEIVSKIEGYTFSFIFIDDGSRDNTLAEIKKLAQDHSDVKYISFSRNFGKEAGMLAGLKASTADRVAIIDADLQHPPELIEKMLYAIDVEGYDSCSARRVSRDGEPKIRSFFSRMFYKLINKMSEVEIIDGAVDFRMMTRQMVDAIVAMPEVNRFSKGIFSWVGYNTVSIPYEVKEREAGETKWNFRKLLKYAFEGIMAYTDMPLKLPFYLAAFSFVLGVIMLFAYSVVSGLVLFVGAATLFSLGVIGTYIGKIHTQVKNRPIYIAKEILSYDKHD